MNKQLDDPEEGGEACRNRVQNHSISRWGSWCRSSWRPDHLRLSGHLPHCGARPAASGPETCIMRHSARRTARRQKARPDDAAGTASCRPAPPPPRQSTPVLPHFFLNGVQTATECFPAPCTSSGTNPCPWVSAPLPSSVAALGRSTGAWTGCVKERHPGVQRRAAGSSPWERSLSPCIRPAAWRPARARSVMSRHPHRWPRPGCWFPPSPWADFRHVRQVSRGRG